MKKIYSGLLLLSFILCFLSCKKGADDPALTLRTRKARLAGDWRLKSGKASYTYNKTYNESFTFDGTRYTHNKTSNGGPLIVYIGSYGLTLNISKDGTFTMNERMVNSVLNAKGSWNFNTGVGERKKKEDVVFLIDKVVSGSTLDEHLFNRSTVNFVYQVKQLKNKEIVIASAGKFYSSSNGSYIDFSTEYTLIQ